MARDFHPGTRATYKKEFATSKECIAYLGNLYEKFERDGYVLVRDVFPNKVTPDANWAWFSLNLVSLYMGGKVFEIKNYPKLLESENGIGHLHFRNDYTLTVLSQYGFIKSINDLRDTMKSGLLASLRGVGPATIEDVTQALEDWFYEHGA